MKRFIAVTFTIFLLLFAYFLSPISYFYVTFKQPMDANEFLNYLKQSGINPEENKVYVLSSALSQLEGIHNLDGITRGKKVIGDTVFNSRPYAVQALFDQRVKSWEFAGPRHPYD